MEPSFVPSLVEQMLVVNNADSVGASTGTNLGAILTLTTEMAERGETGPVLSLLCDSGESYLGTYQAPAWATQHMGEVGSVHVRWTTRCGSWRVPGQTARNFAPDELRLKPLRQ